MTSEQHHIQMTDALNVHTAADLRTELLTAFETSQEVVVDFNGHPIHDSTGIGLLVEACRRAERAGCRLHLTGVEERSQRMLRRVGIARALGLSVRARRSAAPASARLRIA